MNTTLTTSGSGLNIWNTYPQKPEAYVTTNRNRIKSYPGNLLYLQNKQEFEIELFNPTTEVKLARISLNGKSIGSGGIVIKPGARVYLERFLDTAKKFLFETYEVEAGTQALVAIVNNGDVQVDFYDEKLPDYNTYNTGYGLSLNRGYKRDYNEGTGSVTAYFSNTTSTLTSSNAISGSLNLNSFAIPEKSLKSRVSLDSVETGRIEKGSNSNQEFTNYRGEFSPYTSTVIIFKILPISAKPIEAKDLAVYCTNCGTKNKKNNYKFCPKCGTKFE